MSRRVRASDLVADARLVALAAVRQTVKNALLIRALRDGADYDPAWLHEAVRHEFAVLADESESDADRIARLRESARGRSGKALHAGDYRSADRSALKKRERTLRSLAAELRALGDDVETVDTLIDEARRRALDEIAAAAADVPGQGIAPLRGVARSRALFTLREELREYLDEDDD